MRVAANVGLVMWLAGAAMIFGLDGRGWDVAGGALAFFGVLVEVTASALIWLSRRV